MSSQSIVAMQGSQEIASVHASTAWHLDAIVRPLSNALSEFKRQRSGSYSEDPQDYAFWSRVGTLTAGVTVIAAAAWTLFEFFKNPHSGRERNFRRAGSVLCLSETAASVYYGYSIWSDQHWFRIQALQATLVNAAVLYEACELDAAQVKLGRLDSDLTQLLGVEGLKDSYRQTISDLMHIRSELAEKTRSLSGYLENTELKQAFEAAKESGISSSQFSPKDLLQFLHGLGAQVQALTPLLVAIQKWATYDSEHFFTTDHCSQLQACSLVLTSQAERILKLSSSNRLNYKLICLLVLHVRDSFILKEVEEQSLAHLSLSAEIFAESMARSVQTFITLREEIKAKLSLLTERDRSEEATGAFILLRSNRPHENNLYRQSMLNEDIALLIDINKAIKEISAKLEGHERNLNASFPLISKIQLDHLRAIEKTFLPLKEKLEKRIKKNQAILSSQTGVEADPN